MTGIPIKGKAKGSAGAAFTIAKRRGALRLDFLLPYYTELYAFAPKKNINADVLVGQSDLETGSYTSGFYLKDGNVAGFGVPSKGPAQGLKYTPIEAARAQVIHWCAYLGIDVTEDEKKMDPRWDAVFDESMDDPVETTADTGNGTWAEDPDYSEKLVERYTAYWGEPVTTTQGDTTMTTFTAHIFPGLLKPVILPSWIIVEQKIIPSSVPGWTSGQKVPASNFTSTTYHDTDNDRSSATGEYNWAANGGRAEIDSAGSYNGIFDGKRLIIAQRFDELVGHAANPVGNVTSYAFEEAYGADGHDAALEVGMWVHAGVLQAMGKSGGTEAMYQHNYWSGKNCPRQIRDRNQWSYVEKTVDQRVKEINAYLASGAGAPSKPVDPPVVVKPSPVVYPKDLNKEIAAIFFGSAKGNDGRTYGYDENGPVSKMWLAEGAKTGNFPHLVTATILGSAKYFAFSNGLILFQPSPKEVIRHYSAA